MNKGIVITVRWTIKDWYHESETFEEAMEWTEEVLRDEGLIGCVDDPNGWELVSVEPISQSVSERIRRRND